MALPTFPVATPLAAVTILTRQAQIGHTNVTSMGHKHPRTRLDRIAATSEWFSCGKQTRMLVEMVDLLLRGASLTYYNWHESLSAIAPHSRRTRFRSTIPRN